MEIKWIEDFITLADVKNFSQAAQQRNVTQPHFSRRIQALERWLGTTLIDRRTYPISLTQDGKIFRDTAKSIVRDLYGDKDFFHQDFSGKTTDIRISAATTLLLNFLPNWLGVLKSKTTNFTVRLSTRNFHDMAQALTDGDVDFVLQFYHPEIPAIFDETRFDSVLVANVDFLPVSTVDEKGRAIYSLPSSKENPLAYYTYSQDGYLALVENYLQEKNSQNSIYLRRQDTSPTAEVLKSLILASGGIAWLPVNCITRELEEGLLVPVGGDEWKATLEIRLFRSVEHNKPLTSRIWKAAQSLLLDE